VVIRPISIRDADVFVSTNHRHNKAAANGKFAIGCYIVLIVMNGIWYYCVGVGIGGRPRSRHLDNGITFEVYRVCTVGHKNATSFIYSKMKKIAQQMGYLKIITYTLQEESGSSLKAIGAKVEKNVEHKKQWNDHGKTKRNFQPVTVQLKFRWTL
jgi:hypothetical protein